MRLKFNQAIRHTFLYGFSIALMKGISLIMLPFIAHQLAPEEFGRLELLMSVAVIGSVLVGLGLEDALYRFVGQADQSQKRRVAGQIYAMAIVVAILTALMSMVVAPHVVDLLPAHVSEYDVLLVLLLLALESVISVPLGWLRMQDKAGVFFVATVGRVLVQAILTVVFLWNEPTVSDVLEAGLIAAVVQTLFLVTVQLKDIELNWQWALAGQVLVYSYPIVISGMVAFVLMGLDRIVIAEFSSLNDVAIYGVASKFALAVVLLLQPYTMWWSPKRFEVLSSDNGEVKALNFIMLGWVVLVCSTYVVIVLAPLLVNWLMPETYIGAIQILLVLAVAMAFKEASELINIGCFVSHKTYTQMWINIAASGVGLILLLFWTPNYGALGAALAMAVAQATKMAMFFVLSQFYSHLDYPVIRTLLYSISVLVAGLYFSQLEQSLLYAFIALLLLPVFIFIALKIELCDKQIILNGQ